MMSSRSARSAATAASFQVYPIVGMGSAMAGLGASEHCLKRFEVARIGAIHLSESPGVPAAIAAGAGAAPKAARGELVQPDAIAAGNELDVLDRIKTVGLGHDDADGELRVVVDAFDIIARFQIKHTATTLA